MKVPAKTRAASTNRDDVVYLESSGKQPNRTCRAPPPLNPHKSRNVGGAKAASTCAALGLVSGLYELNFIGILLRPYLRLQRTLRASSHVAFSLLLKNPRPFCLIPLRKVAVLDLPLCRRPYALTATAGAGVPLGHVPIWAFSTSEVSFLPCGLRGRPSLVISMPQASSHDRGIY